MPSCTAPRVEAPVSRVTGTGAGGGQGLLAVLKCELTHITEAHTSASISASSAERISYQEMYSLCVFIH